MATVRILRSTTAAAVPPSLVSGQIAINEADGKLFYRNGSGAVTQLATGGGGGGTELFPYANAASFPATGATTALYLSISSGRVYQWNGSVYSEVGPVGGGVSWSAVPASTTATGNPGQVAYDGSYFYICTQSNLWSRSAISTWNYDPLGSSVVLLMHADGSLADSSSYGRTMTAVGGANANGSAKFGSNSLAFDGDGDYLTTPSAAILDLGDNYTIECWVYPNSSDLTGGIVHRGLYYASGNGEQSTTWGSFTASIRGLSSSLRFYFCVNVNNTDHGEQSVDVSQTHFPANTWTHLAMVRSGTSGKVFADGVLVGAISSLNSNASSDQPLIVGTWPYKVSGNDTYAGYWNGRIDELRITKSARYSAAFTPSTEAFPNPAAVPTITISSQPSNQTAASGAATFSVTASVTLGGSVAYQWQKSDDAGSTWANVSGGNSSSLALSSLTNGADNSDQYRVVVSSTGATSVTSSAATLTVASSTPPLSLAGTRPSILASGTTANGYTLTGTGASGSPSVLRIGGGNNNDYRVWLIVNQTGTLTWTVTASSEDGSDGGRLYSAGAPANYTAGGYNDATPAGYTAISNWLTGTQTQTGTTSVTSGQHIVLRWARDDGGDGGNNRIEATLSIA